jgi:hypothetical protein
MAFNVNEFRAKLEKGGARSNLFEVVLAVPVAAAAFPTEEFTFMCRATSLPASRVGVISVPYFGREVKMAGDREFDDWNVTVINDETFDVRNAFERWQSAVASYATVGNNQRQLGVTSNPNSYVATAAINQLGKEGDVVKTVQIINIFPQEIGAIELSWDQSTEIETFDVTFAYDYFISDSNV